MASQMLSRMRAFPSISVKSNSDLDWALLAVADQDFLERIGGWPRPLGR
jgi:hypothetical protein